MNTYRRISAIFILFLLFGIFCALGCVRTTATDQAVIDEVRVYLDAAPDPSNPDALTPEERARIQDFNIVHNIVKVQMVEGTDHVYMEAIGRKMVTAYAQAARRHTVLEAVYYGQIWMRAEVNDKVDNYTYGELTYQNRNDRIEVNMHNPTTGNL